MGLLGKVAGGVVSGAMNLLGGAISDSRSAKASQASWKANYNAQKEFAQNSIQWRVQDAKKAGINPYAVVGGQSVGYTPQDISQTQDFATGISRAGNMLGDMLGQLQLATAKEDLKSKKIDNDIKSVDLLNKQIESQMGQVPKTITKVVKGSDGGLLQTFGDGTQIIKPEQNSGIDEPFGFVNEIMQRFDRASHQANADLNNADLALGIGGYSTIPKNRPHTYYEEVKKRASQTAKNFNELAGVLSIPHHVLFRFPEMVIEKLLSKFKKGGKK